MNNNGVQKYKKEKENEIWRENHPYMSIKNSKIKLIY